MAVQDALNRTQTVCSSPARGCPHPRAMNSPRIAARPPSAACPSSTEQPRKGFLPRATSMGRRESTQSNKTRREGPYGAGGHADVPGLGGGHAPQFNQGIRPSEELRQPRTDCSHLLSPAAPTEPPRPLQVKRCRFKESNELIRACERERWKRRISIHGRIWALISHPCQEPPIP